MSVLQNVTTISYDISSEILTVTYNGGSQNTFSTNGDGQTLQMKRINDQWNLYIDSGQVSGTYTELCCKRSKSDLDFSSFDPNLSAARMDYLGLIDIRDGRPSPVWTFYYTNSRLSLKTSGDDFVIRKEHYS